MLRYLLVMLIPLYILIYTWSFGRWIGRRKTYLGAFAAYSLAAVSFVAAGIALLRVMVS